MKTCPTCDGSGGVETIHYDESGYGNPPERTLERCPTCNGEGEVRAGARTIDGGVWGPLTVATEMSEQESNVIGPFCCNCGDHTAMMVWVEGLFVCSYCADVGVGHG